MVCSNLVQRERTLYPARRICTSEHMYMRGSRGYHGEGALLKSEEKELKVLGSGKDVEMDAEVSYAHVELVSISAVRTHLLWDGVNRRKEKDRSEGSVSSKEETMVERWRKGHEEKDGGARGAMGYQPTMGFLTRLGGHKRTIRCVEICSGAMSRGGVYMLRLPRSATFFY